MYSFYRASLVAQMEKNLLTLQEPWVPFLGWEGTGYPLWYSCLEDPMDRGGWWAIVHGVAESDTTDWLTLSLSLQFLQLERLFQGWGTGAMSLVDSPLVTLLLITVWRSSLFTSKVLYIYIYIYTFFFLQYFQLYSFNEFWNLTWTCVLTE